MQNSPKSLETEAEAALVPGSRLVSPTVQYSKTVLQYKPLMINTTVINTK